MRTGRRARIGPALAGVIAGTILLRLAEATGATILVIIGASSTALLFIRHWLTNLGDRLSDTAVERQQLAARVAQCEVADMANIALRDRLRADATAAERVAEERAAEAEAQAEQRVIEIESALRREYEENRATELANAYFLGATNERNGVHVNQQSPTGELIILSERRRQPAAASHTASWPGGDTI